MLRFRIVEKLLFEDIDAVKKYYPNIDDETFNIILHTDPTYREGSNSVGKYTKWLLNLAKKDISQLPLNNIANMDILKDDLQKFDKLKSTLPSSDIGQFKTIEDFWEVVDKLSEDDLTDRQKERRLRKSYSEADKVFEDKDWEVWIPKTYAASCTLGKGTEWCTATSKTDSYYNRYSEEGPLYIVINKGDDRVKYQFHKESHSFMNAKDNPVSILKVFADDEKVLEFFNNIVGEDWFDFEEEEIQVKKSLETGELDVAPYYETAIDDYLSKHRDATQDFAATILVHEHDNSIWEYCSDWVYGDNLYSEFIEGYTNSKYNKENLERLADYLRLDYTLLAEILTNNYDGDEDYSNIIDTANMIFYDYYVNSLYQEIRDTVVVELNKNANRSHISAERDLYDEDFNTIYLSDYCKNAKFLNLIAWQTAYDNDYNSVEEICYNPLINRFLYDLLDDLYIEEPRYGWEGEYIDYDEFTQQMIDNLD